MALLKAAWACAHACCVCMQVLHLLALLENCLSLCSCELCRVCSASCNCCCWHLDSIIQQQDGACRVCMVQALSKCCSCPQSGTMHWSGNTHPIRCALPSCLPPCVAVPCLCSSCHETPSAILSGIPVIHDCMISVDLDLHQTTNCKLPSIRLFVL